MKEKKEIVHLINDIAIGGGAQKMLYNILKYADLDKFNISVISLLPLDSYKKELEENGITVYILNIKKHPIYTLKTIISILKKADTLFCWMYASNLVGYICGRIVKVKKINFGIRHSDIDKSMMKFSARIVNKLGAILSHSKYITNVIYNGEKAKQVHEEIGYDSKKSEVIINGCDTEKFNYNPFARQQLLKQNSNLKDDFIWIVSATRYHKIKDIPNFIRAIAIIKKNLNQVQVFMCGNGLTEENKELVQLIKENGLILNRDIFLLGLINNLPDIFSACDLYVLHSAAEAFPNTLLEAMACKVECVATNAGDVEKIHPNKNNVVPIGDTDKLSQKILEIIKQKRPIKRADYREVVIKQYSIKNVVKNYELYY